MSSRGFASTAGRAAPADSARRSRAHSRADATAAALADVAVVAHVSAVAGAGAVPEVARRAAARFARRALLVVAAVGWHAARCAGHAVAWHPREQYATPRHAPHRSRAPLAPQRSHAPTPAPPTGGDVVVGFKPTSARCTSNRLASQGGVGARAGGSGRRGASS